MTIMDTKGWKRMEAAMTDWRDHLTPEERQRLLDIDDERRALTREYRRIFDRARKRVIRS